MNTRTANQAAASIVARSVMDRWNSQFNWFVTNASEEMEREQEFYSALLGIEEPVYRKLVKEKEMVAATPGGVGKSPGKKRKSYEM